MDNNRQWDSRWPANNDRNRYDNSRDDYSSNYGYNQDNRRYVGEDYRTERPYRNEYDSNSLYRRNERRDDYTNFDRNREHSSNMGSGYDPYNYGQTVGSFNQGKEGSYSDRMDHDRMRNERYSNRETGSGYDSDYNRSYGRQGGDNSNLNPYRDRYERSGNVYGRDRNEMENRHRRGGQRDWWDRATDEVASWFGDDDAERRREVDKHTGPHRGKGPKGYTRSDERIKDDLNDKLSDDSFIDASEIDVTVEQCEVVLTGTVDSKEEKRRAEDIAERISGVRNVENRLKVRNRENRNDGDTIYRETRF